MMGDEIKLAKRIEVLEPVIPGVNHYLVELWQGGDGKFYVTCRDAYVYPNGPEPVELIEYGELKIIGGPFDTPEDAEKWYWDE